MNSAYLTASALYMGLIWYLSAQPGTSPYLPPLPYGLDKAAHAVEYAILGFLMARAFGARGRAALLAAVLAALYGLTDEYHQSFVPNRVASVWDWSADLAGAIAGALLGARARGRSLTATKRRST